MICRRDVGSPQSRVDPVLLFVSSPGILSMGLEIKAIAGGFMGDLRSCTARARREVYRRILLRTPYKVLSLAFTNGSVA